MTEEYNGWSNYQTWCVNLWLSNDPYYYELVRKGARYAWNLAQSDEGYGTRSQKARYKLSEDLKTFNDHLTEDMEGLKLDLLNHAVSSVDWIELADSWLQDEELDTYECL